MNAHFNVNIVNEVLPIVRIEKNINTFIPQTNPTLVEFQDVKKPTLIHRVSDSNVILSLVELKIEFFLALRKHMKMHESASNTSRASAERHHSFTTDSGSPCSTSFENGTPMKAHLPAMQPYPTGLIDDYQTHPNTSHYYQQRSTTLNF